MSPREFATLERLVDAIIPADERSPGAKDARVADYVDLLLTESDQSAWVAPPSLVQFRNIAIKELR